MAEEFRLSVDDVRVLRGMQDQINNYQKLIERMKRAGLDTTELESRLGMAMKLRSGLLDNFGPVRPNA